MKHRRIQDLTYTVIRELCSKLDSSFLRHCRTRLILKFNCETVNIFLYFYPVLCFLICVQACLMQVVVA
jgi:hypothetical protein